MKTKIQIKNISGKILFELNKENNTIKDTLIAGFRSDADLRYANLNDADLRDADLRGADLRDADLRGADLRYADLRYADLRGANLRDANLRYADLRFADLRYADLSGAYLSDANLSGATLSGADLSGANLRGANLSGADLRGADLRGATLSGAINIPFIALSCPSEGTFIGWKKVRDYLIKLEIPEDAKRCSATTNKCRCDRAKVLSITHLSSNKEIIDEIENNNYVRCIYKVGTMVYPDSYDDDRWNECSNGIHFFINRQEAINY